MSEIYNYISPKNIHIVDDYSNSETNIHIFDSVLFRVEKCTDFYNFYAPIAIFNDKIINISNKQLSFLIYKYHHFVGSQLANQIVSTYTNINKGDTIVIDDTVFQFMDYESISGTGHAYDLMFYLLYIYKKYNLDCKLLVVKSDNKYYNILLHLISKYYNVEFIYIETNTNYRFKKFICTRTYQNIFFKEVKDFINNTMISKIIEKYNSNIFYKTVIKLKYTNQNNINRINDSFLLTDQFKDYITDHNICDLNNIDDEEYKIYLLNKADIIYVSCSSNYYINICYYIIKYTEKNINVIFHNKNEADVWTFCNIGGKIVQHMPANFCGNITDQVYNNISFSGNIINNITSVNEIISFMEMYK
jgi:hypothetical protein